MNERNPSTSHSLAGWSSRLRYTDIPANVSAHAKLQLLDTVGVLIAARHGAMGAAVTRILAGHIPGRGELIARTMIQPPFDALYDATLSACLDFDDTHDETLMHLSCVICPALMSTARRVPMSGEEFLTSLAVGYEVGARVGVAAPGELHRKGFHPTGVIGAVGAAAAVARALDYDPLVTEHAIGLAASVGGGLLQAMVDGTDARYVNAGVAALNGVTACVLAGSGMTAAGAQIDGKFGLLRSHTFDAFEPNMARITAELGRRWETLGIRPKPYPSGYVTHEFVAALLDVVHEYDLQPDEVDEIVCTLEPQAAQLVFLPESSKLAPATSAAARVAMPHIAAEAVVFRSIGAESFSSGRIEDPRVRLLATRVRHELSPHVSENRLRVMARGESIVRKTTRRQMTVEDVVQKFMSNTAAIAANQSRHIVDTILTLEAASDVGSLSGISLE